MPIYEFECPKHGKIEIVLPISKSEDRLTHCWITVENGFACGLLAEKVWSIPAGDLSIGKPTRMFINNRTGDVFSPISQYDKPPRGYHEIELKNPFERSKFEKEQQRKTDGQNQLTSHILDSMKNESRKNRHDNLKAKMNAVQREQDPVTGNTVEFILEPRDKELIKKSMERSKKRKMREKKSDVMLAVNHYDKSNLDEIK